MTNSQPKPNGIVVETMSGVVWLSTERLHSVELCLGADELGNAYYELRIEWNLIHGLTSKRYQLTKHGAETIEQFIRSLHPGE